VGYVEDPHVPGQPTTGRTVALLWDGTSWSQLPSASPNDFNGFEAVAVTGPRNVWAMGVRAIGLSSDTYTLIERYGPPCGTASPTPTGTPPTATRTPTPTPTQCQGYTYTAGTGVIVPGTEDIESHCQDCVIDIALPFRFNLYGNMFDLAAVNTMGALQFTSSNPGWAQICLPNEYYDNAIFALYYDMQTYGAGAGVYTSVSGTAPNRIFNIEWRVCNYAPEPCSNVDTNFEVRLYEGQQSRFDIIYGHLNSFPNRYGTIGVQEGNGLLGKRFTEYRCESGSNLPPNLKLSFTLPACGPPTGTPTPVPGSTLVGHVNWESRPPQPNQLQMVPITLSLRSGTTEVDYPAQMTDQYGFFTVTLGSLPGGTYSWRADDGASDGHPPNYLSGSGAVTIGGPITRVEMGMMRAGDANNDNWVSITDFNMLKVSFGSACGGPSYDMRTDFSADCFVNVSDFNPLKRNFGQSGLVGR
jgi:hypothetical protein